MQGGQHVLAGRFSLPAVGQVLELRGCEKTAADNYVAGATASISADGDELATTNLEAKLRGADSA